MTFWLSLPVHSGSLKKIDNPKQICLAHPLSFECFTALKGTHFYILLAGKKFLIFQNKIFCHYIILEVHPNSLDLSDCQHMDHSGLTLLL